MDDLKSKDVSVRRAALQGLSTMGPAAKDAVPRLLESLKDEDQNVRSDAATALGSMGLDAIDAIVPLTDSLKGPNSNASAAQALARIAEAAQDKGATQLISHLERALDTLLTTDAFKRQTDTVRRATNDLKRASGFATDPRWKLAQGTAAAFVIVLVFNCFLLNDHFKTGH